MRERVFWQDWRVKGCETGNRARTCMASGGCSVYIAYAVSCPIRSYSFLGNN